MILASLDVYHSRPVAPTRRVAIGDRLLPTDPAPGPGGVLLGGVVAAHLPKIDPDLVPDLRQLVTQLEHGVRFAQPRLRHRFQTDRVGLTRSRLRLRRQGQAVRFDFDDRAAPEQYLLAAVYAAGEMEPGERATAMDAVHRGLAWSGPVGPELISHLNGGPAPAAWTSGALVDPVGWALGVLGFDRNIDPGPDRRHVQRRFRALLRDVHPDHGAAGDGAAERIADLSAARHILLTSA